jgi:uncharacterized protein (TIGR02246 family)
MNVVANELEAIDRIRDAHVSALNANDADAWVSCFTPDGVQMPPNDAANIGIENIRAWSTGMLTAFGAEFSLDVEEVELAGERWAFERGGHTIELTPPAGGPPIGDSGKYITIYQRQVDGSWLMARDIWNSNQPLPGQG